MFVTFNYMHIPIGKIRIFVFLSGYGFNDRKDWILWPQDDNKCKTHKEMATNCGKFFAWSTKRVSGMAYQ